MNLQIGRRIARPGPPLDQQAFDSFGALLGTDAPIHVDPGYAARTVFGGTIAQGMLLLAPFEGWLCELFGEEAWSSGGRLEARLLQPARVGEHVTHEMELLRHDAMGAVLSIRVLSGDRVLARGTASVASPA